MPDTHNSDFNVTPWEVTGQVDYAKLIKKFGTQPIGDDLKQRLFKDAGESHFAIRRGVYYSHRDLDLALTDFEEGRRFFLYTGRGPSGPMHLGHIIQFYFTSWLQRRFKANVYIPLTDDEVYLSERSPSLDVAQKWAFENSLDIVAAGFDPDHTFIFKDTEYLGRMYKLAIRVAKKINFSTAKAIFGFGGETNIGFLFYPAIQVVPSLFEHSRCLIPCAIDQDPFWRIQRDIAESLGFPKAAALHSKFLPALTGISGKMSASIAETAIYLNDDERTVRSKIVKGAFSGGQATVEEHRRLGGNTEVDVPFQWLYMFFEQSDDRIEQIRQEYSSGKMLSGELKGILIDKVNEFLKEHRARRRRAEGELEKFTGTGELASRMMNSDLT
ncbi:MAG: tryptophan--tRNA ligase [Nitrososphaerota archaeon]|nr:tryptophan--tRNA ligase [Nitrososphaerota archaeon]